MFGLLNKKQKEDSKGMVINHYVTIGLDDDTKKLLGLLKFGVPARSVVEKSKMCPKCKVKKFLSEFYRNRTTKDGLQSYCKECVLATTKEYYYKNKK